MPYPRLRKNDNDLYPGPEGQARDRALQDETNPKDVLTPYVVELRDIDEQVALLLETGVLSLMADEQPVPVVTVDTERWAEFASTWHLQNSDFNVTPPLITLRRTKEEVGTMMGTRYNVPNKQFATTLRVPTFSGGIRGLRLFQMRQPTRIDCLYEVRLIALVKEDADQMQQNFLREYTDGQLYIKVQGYYFPTVLEDFGDESTMDDIDANRYYVKIFNLRVKGFVQHLEDFREIDTPNRIITLTEVSGTPVDRTVTSLHGQRDA